MRIGRCGLPNKTEQPDLITKVRHAEKFAVPYGVRYVRTQYALSAYVIGTEVLVWYRTLAGWYGSSCKVHSTSMLLVTTVHVPYHTAIHGSE